MNCLISLREAVHEGVDLEGMCVDMFGHEYWQVLSDERLLELRKRVTEYLSD